MYSLLNKLQSFFKQLFRKNNIIDINSFIYEYEKIYRNKVIFLKFITIDDVDKLFIIEENDGNTISSLCCGVNISDNQSTFIDNAITKLNIDEYLQTITFNYKDKEMVVYSAAEVSYLK